MKKSSTFLKSYWWAIILLLFILVCLIFSGLAIFYYWSQFKDSTISNDTQKWGELGDYFGGTLNSLFALINVCVTIWLTITVNKFASKNTDKQIEAEKKVATIQLRHEALKELRTEFDKSFSMWQMDIFKPKYALDCQEPILNFSLNYSYLFDKETIAWCNDFNFRIAEAVIAIRDNQIERVEELFNATRTGSWNLYSRIGNKIIQ